jgi:hypothetical protein
MQRLAWCGLHRPARARYRLSAWAVDSAPESAGATVAYDVPVLGEAIAPLGDYDRFTFAGTQGDVLTAWFMALSGSGSEECGIGVGIVAPGDALAFIGIGGRFGGDSVQTGPFVLPVTGTYRAVVEGDGRFPCNAGTYRFTLHRLP